MGSDVIVYDILPYSNAEFEEAAAGNPSRGWSSMGSEKVAGRHLAMRLGAASKLPGLLDMDLSVERMEPTPFKVRVEYQGHVGHLVPDLVVHNVDGSSWCVHVATPSMLGGSKSWIPQAAVKAMEHRGLPLLVVDPRFSNSPISSGLSYPEARSRVTGLLPEMGQDLARLVDASPKVPTIRELCESLRGLGWPERDPEMERSVRHWLDQGRDEYLSFAVSKVMRAVREGYVDHDPRSSGLGMHGAIHPRLTFLRERTTIHTLLPHVLVGDAQHFRGMADRLVDLVRGGPSPLVEQGQVAHP